MKTTEKDNKTRQIVLGGLFAALTCVSTMMIRIPTLKGYIHFGDGLVITCGIILGAFTGGLAAGLGSMLADILGGYFVFSAATLIIKTISGFSAGFVFKKLSKKDGLILVKVLISGLVAETIMVAGYFSFEIFYEGTAAAIAEIIPNCIQGISGIVISVLIVPVLLRSGVQSIRSSSLK